MKRILLTAALLLSLPLTAHADEASRKAKAQELVTQLHLETLMTKTMDAMKGQIAANMNQMTGGQMSEDEKKRFAAFQEKVIALIQAQLDWKSMEPDFIQLYASTFTDEELDALTAFYKTPAGQSMVAKTPELTAKTMEISQKRLMAIMPQIQQMAAEAAKQNVSPLLTAPPPPPPPAPKTPAPKK